MESYVPKMLLEHTVPINTLFLKNRIIDLGLKQWWLAEQLGVNSRTVLRWYNGQTLRVSKEHLSDLAKLLECEVDQLLNLESPREQ